MVGAWLSSERRGGASGEDWLFLRRPAHRLAGPRALIRQRRYFCFRDLPPSSPALVPLVLRRADAGAAALLADRRGGEERPPRSADRIGQDAGGVPRAHRSAHPRSA